MASFNAKALFLVTTTILLLHTTQAGVVAPSPAATHNVFAANLLPVLLDEHINENVIYSPASIETCLALAFLGAEGDTAEEIRNTLKIGIAEKTEVVKQYGNYLNNAFKAPLENDGPILKLANRIYVNENLKVSSNFNKLALEHFNSSAININFGDSEKSVNSINTWVEEQTENKIQNLLGSGAVNSDTSAVLINAIYFKAKWEWPFSESYTSKADFFNLGKERVQVDTMYQDEYFKFGVLNDLNAKVLELPYENSNITMLLFLPNENEGLQQLEGELKNKDFNDITARLKETKIEIFLPKFRITHEVDLKESLQKLGLISMFSPAANFNGLFDNKVAQKISDARHKAFLDVNEAGSEAAAATFSKINFLSAIVDDFKADHPFFFVIRDTTTVYFAGHVAKL